MSRVPPSGQPHIRMARVPMPTFCAGPIREGGAYPNITVVGVSGGPTHIVILTADGARSHGMLHHHSPRALAGLDALLDYHDAANEDADGLLPHQRADWVALSSAQVIALPVKRRCPAWTPDSIIEVIQAWHRAWGRPPTANEWLVREAARWPIPSTVIRHFGSWNAAIAAAGYEPRARGGHRRGAIAA